MCRVKRVIVVLVSVLTIGVFASAPASAAPPGWMVNGTTLSGTVALEVPAAIDKKFELAIPEAGETIVCSGKTMNSTDATINGSTEMGDAASLEFTECAGEGFCSISTKTISTTRSLLDLTLDGILATKGRFLPLSKNFTTIRFEGEECSLKGTQPVSGSITILEPTGQDEKTLQLVNLTNEERGSIKVASDLAEIRGSVLRPLANWLPYSFL